MLILPLNFCRLAKSCLRIFVVVIAEFVQEQRTQFFIVYIYMVIVIAITAYCSFNLMYT